MLERRYVGSRFKVWNEKSKIEAQDERRQHRACDRGCRGNGWEGTREREEGNRQLFAVGALSRLRKTRRPWAGLSC